VAAFASALACLVTAATTYTWKAQIVAGGCGAACVVLGLVARGARQSIVGLRWVETGVFAALLSVAVVAGLAAAGRDYAWLRSTLHFAVIITAYGVLIPNSMKRAAIAIAAQSIIAVAAVVAIHGKTGPASNLELAGPLAVLAVAALVAFAGAAAVGLFRGVATETRIANMYALTSPLGKGGMGEVWRAQHERLARPAAIKIIRPDVLDESPERAEFVRRSFEGEARMTAQLRSPNTVEVYDFGSTTDGSFYYVMEYLDGLDLQTLVERFGPLPAGRLMFLLEQACMSLADAHDHGLIHRDVKPANIFISRMGLSFDYVKVLDFGLAKPVHDDSDDGVISGTPAYFAPEVITREAPVDSRSDIYALGCVAYFALTGEIVFPEKDLIHMAAAHVDKSPTRPSALAEQAVSRELDALILRCLAKNPADRYENARELLEALRSLPDRTWTSPDAESWWATNLPAPATDDESAQGS